MYRLLLAGLDAAVASLLLIPVFLILNRISFHNWKKTCFCTILAVYLAGVYLVVGLPNVTYIRFDVNINLIPFQDLFHDLSAAFLNIVLFLPLGFLCSVIWNRFRKINDTLMLGFWFSLSIEILQMFTFRASDVNDLITNTLGNLIGWGIGCAVIKLFPGFSCNGTRKDALLVFGTVLTIMFFIHPYVAPIIWDLLY